MDIKVIEAKKSNQKLNLQLKKMSELAFQLCKYTIWQSELENGWIVTKWYKTTKKGTDYKIKPAKNQADFDNNAYEFGKLEKEIYKYGNEEINKSMKILRESINN